MTRTRTCVKTLCSTDCGWCLTVVPNAELPSDSRGLPEARVFQGLDSIERASSTRGVLVADQADEAAGAGEGRAAAGPRLGGARAHLVPEADPGRAGQAEVHREGILAQREYILLHRLLSHVSGVRVVSHLYPANVLRPVPS